MVVSKRSLAKAPKEIDFDFAEAKKFSKLVFQLALFFGGMREVTRISEICEANLSQWTNPAYRRLPNKLSRRAIEQLHEKVMNSGGPPNPYEKDFMEWMNGKKEKCQFLDMRVAQRMKQEKVKPMIRGGKAKPLLVGSSVMPNSINNPVEKVQQLKKLLQNKRITLSTLETFLSAFETKEEIKVAIELLQACRYDTRSAPTKNRT